MARKYYLKLSGTAVAQRMMYDGPGSLSGYTEVTEAVYNGLDDMTDKTFTYSGGVLSSAARVFTSEELRRRAAPDTFTAIESVARATTALNAGAAIPADAKLIADKFDGAYGDYPP